MVYKIARRPSQKSRLLDSAIELVATQGVEALTIDGLAKSAGVTKGGVQYHFSSKDQLVTELLQHLIDLLESALATHVDETAGGKAWLRAYIAVSLGSPHVADGVAAALLAAMPPHDPRALPFEQATQRFRVRAEQGVDDKELAQVIRIAVDGAWAERQYGKLKTSDVKKIRERLLKLTSELT